MKGMMSLSNKMNHVIGDLALEEAYYGKDWRAKEENNAENRVPLIGEVQKIQCHLKFAHNKLVQETKPTTSNHSAERIRMQILDELYDYMNQGQFPRNEARPGQRAPCFVDSVGTPCAVAHLLLKSSDLITSPKHEGNVKGCAAATADLVSRIADGPLQYATIAEIVADQHIGPGLLKWADSFGFSVADLALIQPTYEFVVIEEAEERTKALLERLQDAATKQDKNSLGLDEVQELAHDIVEFGDKIQERLVRNYIGRVIPKDGSFVGSYGGGMDSIHEIRSGLQRKSLSKSVDSFLLRLKEAKSSDGKVIVSKLAAALRAELECLENKTGLDPPPLPAMAIYKSLLSPDDMATWASRGTASAAFPVAQRAEHSIDSLLSEIRSLSYKIREGRASAETVQKLERDVILFGDDLAESYGSTKRRIATESLNAIKKDNPTVRKEDLALCIRPARIKLQIDWSLRSLDDDNVPEPTKSALVCLVQALKSDIEGLEGLSRDPTVGTTEHERTPTQK